MSDLAEFLLARIAEDEQAARVATYCQEDATHDVTEWHVEEPGGLAEVFGSDGLGIIQARSQHPGVLAHIARWDPARVLAECEAKRAILARYERAEQRADSRLHDGLSSEPDDEVAERLALEWVVLTLAAAGADHPDYMAEWTPGQAE